MATHSLALGGTPNSVNKQLTGTDNDLVNISGAGQSFTVAILNDDTSNTLWYRADGGTAASTRADGNNPIPPGGSVEFDMSLRSGAAVVPLSLKGNGGLYTVTVIARPYR